MTKSVFTAAFLSLALASTAAFATEVKGGPALSDPWLVQLMPGKLMPRGTVVKPVRTSLFPKVGLATPPSATPAPTLLRIPGDPDTKPYPLAKEWQPQIVAYTTPEKPGTIVIDTEAKHLYLVMEGGRALRYGVGVAKPGFEWAGIHTVTRKEEWPDWTPPPEMLERRPDLPRHMDGGPNNPLGARALYLGSTLYRIHGSNEPWTIGHAVSSGCIRMRNQDVEDLYNRVGVGTRVIVI